MKIAYFDCIAGASGDMLLGALLDASLDESVLHAGLANLNLSGFNVTVSRLLKNGLSALKVNVAVQEDLPSRTLLEIEEIITTSSLPDSIQQQANQVFRTLAEVEAKIHHHPVDQIHLHELGGLDTIIDVVGVLLGLDHLQIQQVYASPLPMARGFVNSAHGPLPLPAPATLALLENVPLYGTDMQAELVTPTGAVLLKSLVTEFGAIPPMNLEHIGYGAGQRDLPIPNLVRVLIGNQKAETTADGETLVLIETNIDDLNPEIYDYVFSRLFAAGALDVFLSPILMKKNRPASLLSVLSKPGDVARLTEVLFSETSTLGVRQHLVDRFALPRQIQSVETPYGTVRVKIAHLASGKLKAAPEYDDCRLIAEKHGIPLREVYHLAQHLASGEG
ncbi:MAG: nickel pincer cofactor biosynthesis protein LarC [Anaerolineales bacterium]|nr:nickel pincer cofactor biosynthesis protein LarC [Anaerolineales bacterium]